MPLRQATEEHVQKGIAGYGVALIHPARPAGEDEKGRSAVEKAKADNACPISGFYSAAEFHGDLGTPLSLKINGEAAPAGHHRRHDP